jgi:uncharacterized protein (DUF433 family)
LERETLTPPAEAEIEAWEAGIREGVGLPAAEARRLLAEVARLRRRIGPPRIVRTEGVCGGEPTVGPTRICVRHVIALARRYNWDLETLRRNEFPDLSPEEIQLAVDYQEHTEAIEESLRANRRELSRADPR